MAVITHMKDCIMAGQHVPKTVNQKMRLRDVQFYKEITYSYCEHMWKMCRGSTIIFFQS